MMPVTEEQKAILRQTAAYLWNAAHDMRDQTGTIQIAALVWSEDKPVGMIPIPVYNKETRPQIFAQLDDIIFNNEVWGALFIAQAFVQTTDEMPAPGYRPSQDPTSLDCIIIYLRGIGFEEEWWGPNKETRYTSRGTTKVFTSGLFKVFDRLEVMGN